MKVRQVTVGFARTYRGPIEYESFRIEGSVTVDVAEGEDPNEVATKSFPILREQLRLTYREFKPPKPEKKASDE
jgi:hypothetical protein